MSVSFGCSVLSVEESATGSSLVQRSRTEYGVCVWCVCVCACVRARARELPAVTIRQPNPEQSCCARKEN